MNSVEPHAKLDDRFSAPGAAATPWEKARQVLEAAEIYWITTVRADGRPHVTPLIAVWADDALYFTTGEGEQKAVNLLANPACALTTGCNTFGEGLDVVVEGTAVRVINQGQLTLAADAIAAKYGPEWQYVVRADVLEGGEGNVAWLFRVQPVKVLGFAKGDPFSQTTWRF
jgi:PPOX class probable F420-dependent enzyme